MWSTWEIPTWSDDLRTFYKSEFSFSFHFWFCQERVELSVTRDICQGDDSSTREDPGVYHRTPWLTDKFWFKLPVTGHRLSLLGDEDWWIRRQQKCSHQVEIKSHLHFIWATAKYMDGLKCSYQCSLHKFFSTKCTRPGTIFQKSVSSFFLPNATNQNNAKSICLFICRS